MPFSVTVNGTERAGNVEGYSMSITWKLGARPFARLKMFTDDDTYRPTIGHETLVKPNGVDAVFGGSIEDFTESNPGKSVKIAYDVSVTGHEHRMDRHPINAVCYGRHYFESNAISDVLTFLEDNPFQDGYAVAVRSTGTPPAPLSTGTKYYVRDRTSTTCKLSTTSGGSAVNLTDDGTGFHHLIYYSSSVVKKVNAFYGGLESITDGTISDGVAVEQYTWEWTNPAAMLDDLAQLSGYVWFINADKELSFVPRTAFSAPFNISDDYALIDSLTVRYTREEYANKIHARIDERAFAATLVSKTGDGSRRIFHVATPIKEVISITLSAVELNVGIYGESGSDWYFTPGDHWIIQDTGGTTLTGSDTIFITYRALGADAVFVEDAAEQAARATVEGSSGIYGKVVQFDGIYSQAAGADAAQAELDARKAIPVELRYKTDEPGLLPGQLQTVTLTAHDISGASYLIDEVVADDIDVGRLRYTVRALSTSRLGDYLSVFESFTGGGRGSSATGGVAGGGSISGAMVFYSYTATADATVSYAVAAADTMLGLIVKMDATGGWVVDLDTGDFGEQAVFDNAANAVNPSLWYSDGTKWRRLTEIWQH